MFLQITDINTHVPNVVQYRHLFPFESAMPSSNRKVYHIKEQMLSFLTNVLDTTEIKPLFCDFVWLSLSQMSEKNLQINPAPVNSGFT